MNLYNTTTKKKLRVVHRPVEFITPPRNIRLVMYVGRLALNGMLLSHVPQHGLPFRICGRNNVQEALDSTHTRFCRGQLVTQLSGLSTQLRDFIIPSLTIRRCRSQNIIDGTSPQRTSLFLRDNLKNKK